MIMMIIIIIKYDGLSSYYLPLNSFLLFWWKVSLYLMASHGPDSHVLICISFAYDRLSPTLIGSSISSLENTEFDAIATRSIV